MADLIRWARDRKKELEDIASRSWDQLNPLDNGRTWEQRTPTNNRSVNQQLYENGVNNQVGKPLWQTGVKTGNTLRAANAGVIGAIDAGIESVAGSDLSYQKALDRTMAAMDAPLQRGAFLTPQQARSQGTGWKGLKEDFIDPTAQGVAEIAPLVTPVGAYGKGLSLLPRVGMNASIGAAVGGGADATSQLVQTGELDKEQLLKSMVYGAAAGGAFPVVGASLRGGKNAMAGRKPLVPDQAGSVPGNNLDDALNIERFKNRNAEVVAPPPPDLVTQVASLTNEQMVQQMVDNLGLSKGLSEKLVRENNKPALFTNLYGSKDLIRSADNADAYASKIMSEANRRGKAALDQNAPPKIKTQKEKFTDKATRVQEITDTVIERADEGDIQGARTAADRLYEDPEYGANTERGQALYERGKKLESYIKKTEQNKQQPKNIEPVQASDGNMVNPLTGEIVGSSTPRVGKKTYPPNKPLTVVTPEGAQAPLGKIVETFYDSTKGNKKISFKHLDSLGKTVSQAIETELKAIGSTFDEVARKVQAGADNKKINTLEEAGLTPQEANIIRAAQAEMNYVRRRASLGKKEVGQGDFGELYLPRQKVGQYKDGNLFEGFRDTKPGNEFQRKGTMKAEDFDYDTSVIGEYITRYGDTKLYQEERIMRAFQKNNPDAPEQVVSDAAKSMIDLQGRINGLKSKINLGGFGRRKTHYEGKKIDTASEMSEIGRSLGKTQVAIDETPGGLTIGDRINSVEVKPGVTLGHFLGLNQHRDALSYAASQVANAQDRASLAQSVRNRLINDYNLPEETVDFISEGIGRIASHLPDELVTARVESAYKMAAKQQIMEQLQIANISNKTLRRDVSELTNQILREGTIERQASAKIVSGVLQTTNAIFRKLNVSSSLNELSDLTGIVTYYGRKTDATPDFSKIKQYGLGDIDPAIEPYIKATMEGKSLKSVLGSINSATNLYKYVETYKAAVMASTAEKFYKNLKGDALTKQILKDYRDLVLPVDAFTKTFLDSAPLYTQYMSWGARNLQKEGRLITGKLDGGVMKDKTMSERIARDLYANLPAKTVFWLTSNALKGTAIATAFGLTDFTGLTNQDYSGIAEEDKSTYDKIAHHTNVSTTMSLLNSVVQSYEKEKLKNDVKYKEPGVYNPYENNDLGGQVAGIFTPQFYKNVNGVPGSKVEGARQLMEKGYSENKGGRVQYEAPTDAYNIGKAFVFGKNQTTNAREYSGRFNVLDRLKSGENLYTSVKNMAQEQTGLKEASYNRPLSEDYSTAYKSVDKMLRTSLLDGGRKWNSSLDNLKKNDPTKYNQYISSMDGDHVSPEFWRKITGGTASHDQDLKIFKMMGDRKKQLYADMSKAGMNSNNKYDYDPIYDLSDTQARQVLQQKSTATGDDLALRNVLYKEAWYKDYMNKQSEYYKKVPGGDQEFKQTARVKEWSGYNDEYNALTGVTGETLKKDYPLVWQLKQFEFGSQQSKDFLKANYDNWLAQRDALDEKKLAVINKMRNIEGVQAMSKEAYAQATHVEDTDGKDNKKYYARGSGSGSGGGDNIDYTLPKISDGSKLTPKGVSVKKLSSPNFKAKTKKLSVKNIPGSYTSRKLG